MLRAAALVILAGVVMLFLGAAAAARHQNGGTPLLPPHVMLVGWLVSLPIGAALLAAWAAIARRRVRRFERHAGFLPREGRKELPHTGRRTLFRLEYGNADEQLCLMVTRWDYARSSGWRRGAVVEHVWVDAEDGVAIGEQRARLTDLAERREEQTDDARLGGERERALIDERLAERRSLHEQTQALAEELARESR